MLYYFFYMIVLIWSGCSILGYGLFFWFVLLLVNIIKMFVLLLWFFLVLVNSFWVVIFKVLLVWVYCLGYLIFIICFLSLIMLWYFGFVKLNFKLEFVLYVIMLKCVVLVEIEKWDIKDWMNFLVILKLFLFILFELFRMMLMFKVLV